MFEAVEWARAGRGGGGTGWDGQRQEDVSAQDNFLPVGAREGLAAMATGLGSQACWGTVEGVL